MPRLDFGSVLGASLLLYILVPLFLKWGLGLHFLAPQYFGDPLMLAGSGQPGAPSVVMSPLLHTACPLLSLFLNQDQTVIMEPRLTSGTSHGSSHNPQLGPS